jgi:hypothetical protein
VTRIKVPSTLRNIPTTTLRNAPCSTQNRRQHVQMSIDLITTVGGLCATLGVGFGLGILLGRYVWPRLPPVDPGMMVAAKIDIARLAEECATLQNRAGDLDIRCRAATDDARKAAEDVARLAARMVGFAAIAEQVLDPRHDTAPREANLGSARLGRLAERDPAGTADHRRGRSRKHRISLRRSLRIPPGAI